MRRTLARRYPRLLMALMMVTAMLSSGGFAKHAHLWSAHTHGGCGRGDSRCISHSLPSLCRHAHGDNGDAPAAPAHSREQEGAPVSTHLDGSCSVCVELSFLTPTLPLGSPFTTVLAVLALVHEREASQHPDPTAPDVCAARPPPSLA